MFDANFSFISEEFHAEHASPTLLDRLLADGWRHFGTHFFRYNIGFYDVEIRAVVPLRIRLKDFVMSKSQRRVLRKNETLASSIVPLSIDDSIEAMFHRHKARFKNDPPESIYNFVARDLASSPVDVRQLQVFDGARLIAASFFDIGGNSASGIYGTFEPADGGRSLGIFTLLKEIEFAVMSGKQFYYLGYCYEGNSFYDYKKRFRGTEAFDWKGEWKALTRHDDAETRNFQKCDISRTAPFP